NARFEYITQTLLPKPTDTQDEIKGKMKGLALVLDLDPSGIGGGILQNKPSSGSVGSNQRPPLSSFSIGAK
ncbi:hypothetical protein LRR18_17220, partial [Mangrovimonas sp. AS39]|uniref:hypothetical protein n=1 Tax=Mangrovimonas futianensis TaxID=2895523 RepID=UPI001E6529E9